MCLCEFLLHIHEHVIFKITPGNIFDVIENDSKIFRYYFCTNDAEKYLSGFKSF